MGLFKKGQSALNQLIEEIEAIKESLMQLQECVMMRK